MNRPARPNRHNAQRRGELLRGTRDIPFETRTRTGSVKPGNEE